MCSGRKADLTTAQSKSAGGKTDFCAAFSNLLLKLPPQWLCVAKKLIDFILLGVCPSHTPERSYSVLCDLFYRIHQLYREKNKNFYSKTLSPEPEVKIPTSSMKLPVSVKRGVRNGDFEDPSLILRLWTFIYFFTNVHKQGQFLSFF